MGGNDPRLEPGLVARSSFVLLAAITAISLAWPYIQKWRHKAIGHTTSELDEAAALKGATGTSENLKIPLMTAARRAYSDTQDLMFAKIAEGKVHHNPVEMNQRQKKFFFPMHMPYQAAQKYTDAALHLIRRKSKIYRTIF